MKPEQRNFEKYITFYFSLEGTTKALSTNATGLPHPETIVNCEIRTKSLQIFILFSLFFPFKTRNFCYHACKNRRELTTPGVTGGRWAAAAARPVVAVPQKAKHTAARRTERFPNPRAPPESNPSPKPRSPLPPPPPRRSCTCTCGRGVRSEYDDRRVGRGSCGGRPFRGGAAVLHGLCSRRRPDGRSLLCPALPCHRWVLVLLGWPSRAGGGGSPAVSPRRRRDQVIGAPLVVSLPPAQIF
uniref:Uncharacterized protein n=1 Tax=Oryza brachyantha TaxID=4533 RepID=J3MBU7_ORYBR